MTLGSYLFSHIIILENWTMNGLPPEDATVVTTIVCKLCQGICMPATSMRNLHSKKWYNSLHECLRQRVVSSGVLGGNARHKSATSDDWRRKSKTAWKMDATSHLYQNPCTNYLLGLDSICHHGSNIGHHWVITLTFTLNAHPLTNLHHIARNYSDHLP